MARAGRTEPDSVSIWLKLSAEDAARMTQVLARPEFAGWTRPEWCREIIRSALRYYLGDAPAPDPGQTRAHDRPAAAQPVSPSQPTAPMGSRIPAEGASPAARSNASEPESAAPEPPAQPECSHPAAARDYDTGTCAACGAILWD